MTKKRPSAKRSQNGRDKTKDSPATVVRGDRSAFPSGSAATILSAFAIFHLFAVFISFTRVVEPSAVHASVAGLLEPYLRPTHFSAGDRPVYLADGSPGERPHRMEFTEEPLAHADRAGEVRWTTIRGDWVAGVAASDRQARWLAEAAALAEAEQPGLVADLLLPVVRQTKNARAIRIVRLTTDLDDINAEPESPYVASVVRDQDRIWLVQLRPSRLSTMAAPRKGESP